MKRIQRLDVFPKFDRKFEQDARQRTALGGILSVLSIVIITSLIVGELRYFFSVEEQHEMYVDPQLGGRMSLTVNLTFYRVPCDLIMLDSINAFGIFAEDVGKQTVKTRVDAESLLPLGAARPIVDEKKIMTAAIDPDGALKENCPSCYGAERDPGDCCYTCDDVRQAYGRKGWQFNLNDVSVEQCATERVRLASAAASTEGCNIYASFDVARVTGNLHFVPGRMYHFLGRRMHDFMGDTATQLNLSHVVHHLEYGERFPGQVNPLDGVAQIRPPGAPVNGRFSYFVKIVPTTYQSRSLLLGLPSTVETNQYSVTQYFSASKPSKQDEGAQRLVPGVFITYDLSPIKIYVSQTHPYPSVLHFLLQLCAVCGGVFTVAGLVDMLCYHSVRRLKLLRSGKQL